QIQSAEPVPPRQVRPELPRDLETIIVKCLVKEPGRRYASARELADDLRAFREGRAIKARRPSIWERAGRWVKQHRRGSGIAALATGVTVLLIVAAFLVWKWYSDWRLGRLTLYTEEPRLVAEVLEADRDVVVLPAFPAPTRVPKVLPAGSYRLRLSAPGLLSE